MRKRITGIMLGIVLFIMSPLTVSAAPMVPAPFTSDQLLPVAQAAMAGVTTYQIALVSSSESNKYNPTGKDTVFSIYQITGTSSCIHILRDQNISAAGKNLSDKLDQYFSLEGNMEKNYIHRNDIPWFVLTDPVTEKNLSKYNIQYALRLYDSDTINNVVPVYTDGEVYQFTQSGNGTVSTYTFDAASMLLIGIRQENSETDSKGRTMTVSLDYVFTYNQFDTLTVPAEVIATAKPMP